MQQYVYVDMLTIAALAWGLARMTRRVRTLEGRLGQDAVAPHLRHFELCCLFMVPFCLGVMLLTFLRQTHHFPHDPLWRTLTWSVSLGIISLPAVYNALMTLRAYASLTRKRREV